MSTNYQDYYPEQLELFEEPVHIGSEEEAQSATGYQLEQPTTTKD